MRDMNCKKVLFTLSLIIVACATVISSKAFKTKHNSEATPSHQLNIHETFNTMTKAEGYATPVSASRHTSERLIPQSKLRLVFTGELLRD